MKLIDEKGRLFGVVNIIDLAVILLLLSFIPMFYIGHRFFFLIPEQIAEQQRQEELRQQEAASEQKRQQAEARQARRVPATVYTDVIFKELQPDVANLISVGDVEKNSDGGIVGEIIEVGDVEKDHSLIYFGVDAGGNATLLKMPNPDKREVICKMRMQGYFLDRTFYYKGNILAGDTEYNTIGRLAENSRFEFKTQRYVVEGGAINFKTKEQFVEAERQSSILAMQKQQKMLITLRCSGIIPEVGNLIKEGDQMINATGEVVAELKSIVNVPAPIAVQDINGAFYIAKHPLRREITISFEAHCIRNARGLFVKSDLNNPIKIGNSFTFGNKDYGLGGTIVDLKITE